MKEPFVLAIEGAVFTCRPFAMPIDTIVIDPGRLSEFCKSGLAPFKYPRWINFVTELPKTATGKIQRFKLRQDSGAKPINS